MLLISINKSREIEIEKSAVLNNWRSLDSGEGRTARWVEFWSEAAAEELEFVVAGEVHQIGCARIWWEKN